MHNAHIIIIPAYTIIKLYTLNESVCELYPNKVDVLERFQIDELRHFLEGSRKLLTVPHHPKGILG